MPAPATPSQKETLEAILLAVQELQALVIAQGDDIDKIANYQRYIAESAVGANTDIVGIWEGTDRYPEV